MYSYYFLAACKIRLPAWFAQCLTSAQITQFLITLAILAHAGIRMVNGLRVDTSKGKKFFVKIFLVIPVVM